MQTEGTASAMRSLYVALGGFLLGVGAFFTFVVPQVAFSVLGGHGLSVFLGAVFPRFYLLVSAGGVVLCALGLLAFRVPSLASLAPLAALLLTVVAWVWLLPLVHRAEGTASFGALHGLSLGLDILAMLLWLAGVAAALIGTQRRPAR